MTYHFTVKKIFEKIELGPEVKLKSQSLLHQSNLRSMSLPVGEDRASDGVIRGDQAQKDCRGTILEK